MIELLAIGLIAGVIAGISPCVLPVLPVVLVTGATGRPDGHVTARRSLALAAGLVVSFTALTLAGSEILSALHLPQNLLEYVGLGLLALIGLGLLVPPLGALLARPFERISPPDLSGRSSGFVIGLGLGAVFTPCAGPILTAIVIAGATHRIGWESVLLTLSFSIGATIPLLVIARAGSEITRRVGSLRQSLPLVRRIGGVILIVMSVVIATNVTDGLQRSVPGYTNALQNHFEGSVSTAQKLAGLDGVESSIQSACAAGSATLGECGAAPQFVGIAKWLNTPKDRALSIAGLRGKVVLVDFWTYSCINCQRSLPHVEAWYSRYKNDGLVVVGVHTPEFAFEHVISNVTSAAADLGVHYPIAIDNSYSTWDAYANDAWPADYLIDASGKVRAYSVGEGGYSTTEQLIRELLEQAHPGLKLPKPTEVPNRTPTETTTPETYLGYERAAVVDDALKPRQASTYTLPGALPFGQLALGGRWTANAEELTTDGPARLEYGVLAKDVYLVLGGSGQVTVSVAGRVTKRFSVSGIPRLYTLVKSPTTIDALLGLSFTKGIQAYDMTFG